MAGRKKELQALVYSATMNIECKQVVVMNKRRRQRPKCSYFNSPEWLLPDTISDLSDGWESDKGRDPLATDHVTSNVTLYNGHNDDQSHQ